LKARNIGSAAMSGRISAIDAVNDASGKVTLYVGAASGGVWKSIDGGTTFKPVFDEQPVQSIGAIAIDRKDPKTVWVGSGEGWTRNSVSVGNGIYKSTDGGESWKNVGLPESERITEIAIDPKDSNTVYACVPGKLWSDSAERGLYVTRDGGSSWTLALKGSNLSTGCSSVSLDATSPNVVYAALWDFRRKGWTFRSGGESATAESGSGLYKSLDSGKSWTEVTESASKGFAKKPYGRIAVAVAPSNSQRVYAFVESTRSALLVSDDGGKSWEERDRSQWMVWRPFYFAHLIVDPKNADRVFKTDGALIMSEDAGKSFASIGGFNGMHGDVHAVWIDPANTQHVIAGDDGGLWHSYNGAAKWWKADNLPISQFYHVSVDNADPYRVYGGLQDNSSWVGDSAFPGGITSSRWENLYGGDGFWMFEDPSDSNYVYGEAQGGSIGRVNRKTHETRDIQPKPNYNEKLRFNWNTPIALSPHDKNSLYIGAQFLFKSQDHGNSWQRISPDLTTNDPEKQKQEQSGGVTVDNSAAEMHTTLYSISESPKASGTLWVGTDDGNVQLTRDGGAHWQNLVGNITGLPKNSWVSWVEASRFDAATAYVAFDRHTAGDVKPYLYKTSDYGKTWTALISASDDKGVRGYAHVIREDLKNPQLLFLGTEFGLSVSIDGGAHWAAYQGNHFPAVAVRDIAVQARDNDLILATHGRGIWIIDDITPLRRLTPQLMQQEAAFVEARPVQQRMETNGGWANGAAAFAGDNPASGAAITYWQKSLHLYGKLKIEVLNAKGEVVDVLPASKRRGLNRIQWSMHEKPPLVPPAVQLAFAGTQGPRVLPGHYTVRLTKSGKAIETPLNVGLDRRSTFTAADRTAQYEAANQVKAIFAEETQLLARITGTRSALVEQKTALAAGDALIPAADALDAKLDTVRKQIVATTEGGAITGEERLREHTDQLYGAILNYEGHPTRYQLARIGSLKQELGDTQKAFDTVIAKNLADYNALLKTQGKPALAVPAITALGDDDSPRGGRMAAGLDRDALMSNSTADVQQALKALRLH
jgi:photosystem II stability/assembly factor-like uncharacterized protein